MKRIAAALALTVLALAVFVSFSPEIRMVSAQNAGYSIQQVDHQVEVMYSGYVVINDTIQVTGQITDGFLIGFPYKYGAQVLKGVAYDANGALPMSLGVSLGNRTGFYGASISFPQGSPQVFTAIFILSNSLVTYDSSTNLYTLDFPAYPSFVQGAAECNVTVAVPGGALSMAIAKDDGIVDTDNFVKENLAAFTYSPAQASFAPASNLQMIGITELDRVITIGPLGNVAASDSYYILNNSTVSLSSFELSVPTVASNTVAKDEFGNALTVEDLGIVGNIHLVNVTFSSAINASESIMFTADYTLPSISPEQTNQFALNVELFPYFDYYVDVASVTIVPPEGARFLTPQLSSISPSLSLNREIFQETLTLNREGVSYVDNVFSSENTLQVSYEYNLLWVSFGPTLWVWAAAVVASAFIAFWRRPKPSAPLRIVVPKLSVGLSPDQLRTFTDSYEEKNRITSELDSLDLRAQKGRMPRRRYKVQRRTLEVRLDSLSKNITELKETFRSAGGVYADLVRQLDAAETDFNEAKMNIKNVEARQKRGALSLEEYKKSLADSQRKKEKAETAINGILLRIREETH